MTFVDQATNEITHVTIAPGVTTGELMEVFLEEGVCFESDVILMGVTYGGVIPTACHVRFCSVLRYSV